MACRGVRVERRVRLVAGDCFADLLMALGDSSPKRDHGGLGEAVLRIKALC